MNGPGSTYPVMIQKYLGAFGGGGGACCTTEVSRALAAQQAVVSPSGEPSKWPAWANEKWGSCET